MGNFAKDKVFVKNVVSYLKPYFSKVTRGGSPLDTLVLRAHYKASVGIFLCLFVTVTSFWLVTDPMKCILKFDRSQVIGYLEDICLSYPYVYNTSVNDSPRSRVYALHYRWVHYAILILVFLYNLPLLCRKYLDREDINYFLKEVCLTNPEHEKRERAAQILTSFIGRLGLYYFKALLLHFIIFIVNAVSFIFLDIVLQNRFARLFPLDYPFTRWPQYFNDTLSIAFPPFVECKIGAEMMLLINREETLGCSLPLMTIYQKFFIFMWLWIVILSIWSLFSLVYYIYLPCKCRRKAIVYITGCKTNLKICVKYLSIGDLIILNKLRTLMTAEEYREIIQKVSTMIIEEKERGLYKKGLPNLGWTLPSKNKKKVLRKNSENTQSVSTH